MQQLEFSLESFENSAKESNGRYWNAHEFMHNLGYETWTSFNGTINRAMASCAQLGVEISEAFISETIIDQGASVKSYRLSRFACFLITMHADSKKPRVQQAKVALAAVADALVEQHIQSSSLARIDAREDLKHAEKVMTSIASEQGLESENIGFFKDAGFRGMYNMSLTQLKSYKNIESKSTLYDFMGLTELAGNCKRNP
jgi:DNA-damage-inducible protein D